MIMGFLAGLLSAWRLAARVIHMEEKEREEREKERLREWEREHSESAPIRKPKRESRVIKERENQYGENHKGSGR